MVGEEASCSVDGALDVILGMGPVQVGSGRPRRLDEDAVIEHVSGVCGTFLSTACLIMVQDVAVVGRRRLVEEDAPGQY